MAASRVYLAVHHVSDVVVGLAVGACTGAAFALLADLMASLEVGIVGLPNSGKTSLFNALTESHAEVTSYAAVQASANVGIAAVPDDRIAALAEAVSAREQVPATVQFSDVSGLVRGAAPATAGSAANTSGTCARPTRWRTSCAASTTRRCRTPTAASTRCADAEAVDFELLLSDQVLVAEPARARGTRRAWARSRARRARRARAAGSRASTRACPRARSTIEAPRASTCSPTKPVIYVANISEAGDASASPRSRPTRSRARRRGRAPSRRASRPSWPSSTIPPSARRSWPTSASTSRACRASRAPASARSA